MGAAPFRAALLGALLLGGASLGAQAPARYLVTLRDRGDTGVVTQRARRLGHTSAALGAGVMLVRERPGGRRGLRDSLLELRRSRRTTTGRETMQVEEDLPVALELPPIDEGLGARPLEAAPAWHVAAVHAPEAWELGYTGAGIITAALDGAGGFSNPNIAPNILGGWNAIPGADTSQGYQVDSSCSGHGTHTFSSMSATRASGVGVAPDSKGYQIRVFETAAGFGCLAYTSSTLRGANYAADHGARVLNVSIAHAACFACAQVAADLKARGVIFSGSNGNSSAYGAYWPASDPNSIGSAGIDAAGNRAGWSNYGPTTDFGSPGVSVLGALEGTGLGYKSGTSMASPTSAGALVLVMSAFPSLPIDTLVAAMRRTADSLPGARPNDLTGWGRPNAARAIADLSGGVAVSWRLRTYPATTTDSVLAICAQRCEVTASGGVTILRVTNYVVFSAASAGGLSIRSQP